VVDFEALCLAFARQAEDSLLRAVVADLDRRYPYNGPYCSVCPISHNLFALHVNG
jgi:hypothetical protein